MSCRDAARAIRSALFALVLALPVLLLALSGPVAAADGRVPIKLRLDWVWQAQQSVWTLAAERGYFAEEGLDITIDRGYGGPDTLGNVASGAYEFGFSDINTMIPFNAKTDKKLICPFVFYDATMASVMTRKGNGINTPKDLEGKSIGAPLTTGGRTLFPAFAKAAGIDEGKINWQTISIDLQDPQFARGNFDAIAGFVTTSFLNLKALGMKREDITFFNFKDYGLDLYGSSIVVRPEYAAANPEIVKKFIRATIKGLKAVMADKKAAIASLQKRDPLLNMETEIDRLNLTLELAVDTPNVRKNGISAVETARLERSIAFIGQVFEVSPLPPASQVFTGAYLPPVEERLLKF